ncbi:sensor histidine kinase [Paenimyroides aestuarii]|uniref:Sensor histidine kinase n=1 Tax=Paenimyroides aestuarii TaxID=2968490 RepID=A0ABY5NPA1_9FLAO|nr:sensor histidine kinase [Paenimyroides aestuarii]UUV20371.1 sensor histidine kinase [Paenimyroides aestuarii]
MKNFTQKIYQNRFFLLFILLFAYVQSIYIRVIVRKQINAYAFTPDAALASLIGSGVLFLILLFFIKKWNKSETFSFQVLLKIFGASLFVYLLATNTLGLLIAVLFDNIERNFNQQTFILSLFSNFLDGLIYGGFFLAYYYFLINKKQQKKIAMYNKAMTESKINQLKTQLNPHFLFNNLNVLDQLIEEDKEKASDFLNEFAEIYRYVLQSTDKELVRIEDEIDFAQQYFKLIQHKYNNAYRLQIEYKSIKGFIIPMTLQLLVENAVKHNLGTEENPVCIQIKIDENIAVSNNANLKRNSKTVSGRALKNLKEQYSLLSEKPIQIHQMENYFSVEVPIIHNQNV